jgi:aspartyl-tRNA(Asn)/glutamyl-tRNA(Gln) amidotransferase subunit B
MVVSFLQSDVLRVQREAAERRGVAVEDLTEMVVSAEAALGLLAFVGDGTISLRMAKDVLDEMFTSGRAAADIVREKGLVQVSDEHTIAEVVLRVLDTHSKSVVEYFAGKEKMIAFFVGQTMKLGGGKLNPAKVNAVLLAELEKRRP